MSRYVRTRLGYDDSEFNFDDLAAGNSAANSFATGAASSLFGGSSNSSASGSVNAGSSLFGSSSNSSTASGSINAGSSLFGNTVKSDDDWLASIGGAINKPHTSTTATPSTTTAKKEDDAATWLNRFAGAAAVGIASAVGANKSAPTSTTSTAATSTGPTSSSASGLQTKHLVYIGLGVAGVGLVAYLLLAPPRAPRGIR